MAGPLLGPQTPSLVGLLSRDSLPVNGTQAGTNISASTTLQSSEAANAVSSARGVDVVELSPESFRASQTATSRQPSELTGQVTLAGESSNPAFQRAGVENAQPRERIRFEVGSNGNVRAERVRNAGASEQIVRSSPPTNSFGAGNFDSIPERSTEDVGSQLDVTA